MEGGWAVLHEVILMILEESFPFSGSQSSYLAGKGALVPTVISRTDRARIHTPR